MADIKSTKTKKPAKEATHPKYSEMVATAIGTLKERGGSSRVAIIKFITSKYKVSDNPNVVNSQLKLALKKGVDSGALTQVKGTGASGSFKLAKKAAEKPKKAVKSPKKAKSPKANAKKVAKSPRNAVKSPQKAKVKKAAKSPKTKKVAAKKPKAVKSPKTIVKSKMVAKSPKKAAKPKPKKTVAEKTTKKAVKKPTKK